MKYLLRKRALKGWSYCATDDLNEHDRVHLEDQVELGPEDMGLSLDQLVARYFPPASSPTELGSPDERRVPRVT